MEPYRFKVEIDLNFLIAEMKEFTQACNEFVKDLELIQSKYADEREESEELENAYNRR